MSRIIKFRAWFLGNDKEKPAFIAGFNMVGFSMHNCQEVIKLEPHVYRYDREWKLSEIVLEQFTGLKDLNGKEIYDGDIIQHPRQSKPYSKKTKKALIKCIVEWNSGDHADPGLNPKKLFNPSLFNTNPGFIARPIDPIAEESSWGYDWSEFHDCKVIGNIHQNPELLNPIPLNT